MVEAATLELTHICARSNKRARTNIGVASKAPILVLSEHAERALVLFCGATTQYSLAKYSDINSTGVRHNGHVFFF